MDNYIASKQNERTEWTDMWKNIKDSFKSRKFLKIEKVIFLSIII
jgi:hypothetical protein